MTQNTIYRLLNGEVLEENLEKILKEWKLKIEKNYIISFTICQDEKIINSGFYYKDIIFYDRENIEKNNSYTLIITKFKMSKYDTYCIESIKYYHRLELSKIRFNDSHLEFTIYKNRLINRIRKQLKNLLLSLNNYGE